MFAALRTRVRTALRKRVRPVLLGSDRSAVRSHYSVAGLITVVLTAVTALTRVVTVVVSPVVWDAFLTLSAVALFALTVANAYWHGGLLVGYTLVFAPTTAGLFVAYVGRGPFGTLGRTLGFGFLLVAAVAVVVGTPGFVLGRLARWVRERSSPSQRGAS